jgi:hypothetical protein
MTGLTGKEIIGGWTELHNEELHNLYPLIKSRRMRWTGHVACMGYKRSAYRVLVGKPENKRLTERPRHGREGNIKMILMK